MNYPLIISGVLNFLQCHSLQKQLNIEIAFVTDGDKDESGQTLKLHERENTVCRYWEEGTCKVKTKHNWSECPKNRYSKNRGKEVNEKGELILCTIEEITNDLEFNDDDLLVDDLLNDSDNLMKYLVFTLIILYLVMKLHIMYSPIT